MKWIQRGWRYEPKAILEAVLGSSQIRTVRIPPAIESTNTTVVGTVNHLVIIVLQYCSYVVQTSTMYETDID